MPGDTVRTPFTGEHEADELLSRDGLALLVGMLLDQQIPMEWAFRGPWELARRLGSHLDAGELAAMEPSRLKALFAEKPALHRYPGSMAERVQALCRHLVEEYGGRAEAVWEGVETPRELFDRLRRLPGFGEQKARIFLAVLGKRLGVAPPGWEALAGDYGLPGYRSIADVSGPGTVEKVREHKQALKRAKAARAGS